MDLSLCFFADIVGFVALFAVVVVIVGFFFVFFCFWGGVLFLSVCVCV